MKTIIAGSTGIRDKRAVLRAVFESKFDITEIVSGGAPGVDTLGEEVAFDLGLPVQPFVADWIKYGKAAGPIRNQAMADYADALIAVWDGTSRGTKDMMKKAKKKRLKMFVYLYPRRPSGGRMEEPLTQEECDALIVDEFNRTRS